MIFSMMYIMKYWHVTFGVEFDVAGLELELDKDIVVAYESDFGSGKRGEESEVLSRAIDAVFPDSKLSEAGTVGNLGWGGLDAFTMLLDAILSELPQRIELAVDVESSSSGSVS